jgi:hypothetical protein
MFWCVVLATTAARRDVVVVNDTFVNTSTGKPVLLVGANVVMKGPPWIPAVSGDAICDTAPSSGANTSCATFNAADARNLKHRLGYNFIRLGVVWAGAQPNGAGTPLDAAWLARLGALLDLAHAHGIAVLLDLHQDAVGTATCGEGVPQWFSAQATPGLIGKPLWPLPAQPDGSCGANDTAGWGEYGGDSQYNIKNRCCRLTNQGSWGRLGYTVQAQETMLHLFASAKGRAAFAAFAGALAEAVEKHPAAMGLELMNEPPAIFRREMYLTWQACYDAVRAVSTDLAVSVQDTSQAALPLGDLDLAAATVEWLKGASGIFYAFHWYGSPKTPAAAFANAKRLAAGWGGRPTLLTEFGGYGDDPVSGGCAVQRAARDAGIGSAFWHYSDYCWPKYVCALRHNSALALAQTPRYRSECYPPLYPPDPPEPTPPTRLRHQSVSSLLECWLLTPWLLTPF